MDAVRGYKVFNSDWTCRGFQYEVGKIFEENVVPKCCKRGFHFCKELVNCFESYPLDFSYKIAEVLALGRIDNLPCDDKYCTDKIKIVREISWEEAIRMINAGNVNIGLRNTGGSNKGCMNIGWANEGDENTGNANLGNFNSGQGNIGWYNSGDYNKGSLNTGCWNIGDQNTGDWNKTNLSNGCFNTEEPKIAFFNKLSDWTYRNWMESSARFILSQMPKDTLKWIQATNMTDEEQLLNPEYKITDGYLKRVEEGKDRQRWWDNLDPNQRKEIISLPNFDAKIFKEITGIKVYE